MPPAAEDIVREGRIPSVWMKWKDDNQYTSVAGGRVSPPMYCRLSYTTLKLFPLHTSHSVHTHASIEKKDNTTVADTKGKSLTRRVYN